MSTLQTLKLGGWLQINDEGAAALTLSIIDEGLITSAADTPANTQYRPRIKNPESFSIKRSPPVWPQQDSSVQGAAFGQLEIDNYDGAFDNLLAFDLRDASLSLKLVTATPFGGAATVSGGFLVATGIVDTVTCDDEDIITVTFKDTIARLDKTLPCRYNPPFVDSSAASAMMYVVLGPFRNLVPQLIDSPTITYRIGDASVSNITQVCDKAAALDRNANPPQYVPALSNAGLALQAMPVGKLTCTGSSAGQQAVIPGVNDILAGAGAFPGLWNSGVIELTTSGVSIVTGAYRFNTASPSIGVGFWVFLSDGTNSVYGQVASIFAATQYRLNAASQIVVGNPLLIPIGSSVIDQSPPTSFLWSGSGGIGELVNPPNVYLGANNACYMTTGTVWNPTGGKYGAWLSTSTAILQAGVSYRLTFSLYNVQSCNPYFAGGMQGGLMVTTALSGSAADYITGYGQPLNTPGFNSRNFTFDFTVPAGAARKLYFMAVPSAGNSPSNPQGTVICELYNVKLEQLGQFVDLPLQAISMTDYFTEILVNRAGEPSSIFSSADTDAIGIRDVATVDGPAGSLIPFSQVFTSPPNILDALRVACDNFCATVFTDATGQIRCRRLVDPSDPANHSAIRADFDTTNVIRPIQIEVDKAQFLTTMWGARRNWTIFSAADFVTDQNLVSQDTKTRYMRLSQFIVKSSVIPAGEYSFAISQKQFDTTIDIANDCQLEADRVVSMWAFKVYSDGTYTNGKRRIVTFTVLWDDPTAVGATITTALTNIQFGDIIKFTYPSHGFNGAFGAVLEWEIVPFDQKLILTVMI